MPNARPFPLTVALCLLPLLAAGGCGEVKIEKREKAAPVPELAQAPSPEHRLEGTRPLTSEGVNRQASFDPEGQRVIWLCRPTPEADFQIRVTRAGGSEPITLDTGPGRRYGPSFAPDGSGIIYAAAGPGATGAAGPDGPGGLWLFDPGLEIWRADPDGAHPIPLTDTPGYDAEASCSWGGGKIVFTSFRDGSGSLWLMDADGGQQERLLAHPPYAGGAQLSPDGSRVAFHAATGDDAQGLEIYVADVAGGNPRRLTSLGATSFGPVWHPSQQYLVFSSNTADRDFELYLIRPDGTGLERITHSNGFDGFPAFSRDGRQLMWTSQRQTSQPGQTQIFRASWQG